MHCSRTIAFLLTATATLSLLNVSPGVAGTRTPKDPNQSCALTIAQQTQTIFSALEEVRNQMGALAESCTAAAPIDLSLECSVSSLPPHKCELERKKRLGDDIIASARAWADQQGVILGPNGCGGKLKGFSDMLAEDYQPLLDESYDAANGTISGGCGAAPAGIIDGTHSNTIGITSPDGVTAIP